jgi:hypothetical protein
MSKNKDKFALMIQFNEEEPIQCMEGVGDTFTLELKTDGAFVSFISDKGKTFKMMCKKI